MATGPPPDPTRERSTPGPRRWIACAFWTAMILALVVPKLYGVRTTRLTRDVTAIGELPFYTGLISSLGILVWCVGSTVCLFAAAILRPDPRTLDVVREGRAFLARSGLLCTVLLADDLLLLHEEVVPRFLGWSEHTIYALYAAAGLLLALRFRAFVLARPARRVLFVAIFLLGVSVLMDINVLPGGIGEEDLCKFYGIGALVHFLVATANEIVRLSRATAPEPAP